MIAARRPRGAIHRMRHPQPRVDWFRVLADLQYLGKSTLEVSRALGIPEATVRGWKGGTEPRHADGEALLRHWRAMTGKTQGMHPMCESAGFRRFT